MRHRIPAPDHRIGTGAPRHLGTSPLLGISARPRVDLSPTRPRLPPLSRRSRPDDVPPIVGSGGGPAGIRG
jgi:hypothetical protein